MPDYKRSLQRAARVAGIADHYVDAFGTRKNVSVEVLEALLKCLAAVRVKSELPGVVLARAGAHEIMLPWKDSRTPRGAELSIEDSHDRLSSARPALAPGGIRLRFKEKLPLGTHRLRLEGGKRLAEFHVISAPSSLATSVRRAGRHLAVFLPIHSIRGRTGFGVGTYSDLQELVRWASSAGSPIVGTLPLFPSFLDTPFDPSPYAPISRLCWSELFLDLARCPEWGAPQVQRVAASAGFQRRVLAARRGDWVDYRKSWGLVRQLLSEMSRVARRSSARWKEIETGAGRIGREYSDFRAARERSFSARGRSVADLFLYAQAQANLQMANLGAGGKAHSLYLDLPVGVHPRGFDVWRRPELFLQGVSAGAPPDTMYTAGQVWGFPPMHPETGRADGYAYLREVLRRMLSASGVLRVDHVMGLLRMYCVPQGFGGARGAYLYYPANELFAVVMTEAARAGAIVVGEDLGTVPEKIRVMMRRRGMLGMHVQQFCLGSGRVAIVDASNAGVKDGTGAGMEAGAGVGALASLNTHDTPTFAGFWNGDDIGLRRKLGLINSAGVKRERRERAAVKRAVVSQLGGKALGRAGARNVALALMKRQARGSSPITLVNLEDLWGERRPQNVPGTSTEYPNWRRRARKSLNEIVESRETTRTIRELADMRISGGRARRKTAT
ncbi:MAG: 4-alpha-glucanotransferase [Phycisphaeraceae bacterium]|nr:4-alpha-glucanotransferase [Phycisphaeraceae bacterium]